MFYIVSMKKNNGSENVPQGGKSPVESSEINLATVEKWLKNDLAKAISCLNAIYSDPDLLRSVSTFMLGRMNNAKLHQEAAKAQTKMDL